MKTKGRAWLSFVSYLEAAGGCTTPVYFVSLLEAASQRCCRTAAAQRKQACFDNFNVFTNHYGY